MAATWKYEEVNEMSLRRLNKIHPLAQGFVGYSNLPGEWDDMKQLVASFNKNLQDLGYTLHASAIKYLSVYPLKQAEPLFSSTIKSLKALKGVHNYRAMYPNFPLQVIAASDAELYLNAITHYFSAWAADVTGDQDYIWLPKYRKDQREPLDENIKLRVLTIDEDDLVFETGLNLLKANTSLSDTDKKDLELLFHAYPSFGVEVQYALQRGEVVNKETLALVAAELFNRKYSLGSFLRTATDVLRLAVQLSAGDVSLAKPTKFRKFSRSDRRRLIHLLNNAGNIEEDMLRHRGMWLKLGHGLHIGDYAKLAPTAFKAITNLRNKTTEPTFNSRVEALVRTGHKVQTLVDLLSTRPGDFGRRLDHILRRAANTGERRNLVLDAFKEVAPNISTPVLLQMMAHFQGRGLHPSRTVFPKGNVAKIMSIAPLPSLDLQVSFQAYNIIYHALRERFAALSSMGKVYIDPVLSYYLLPFSQRSASKSLRTIVRGSQPRFTFSKDTIRLFLWWKEPKNDRTDLDLSVNFYDKDWNHLNTVAYYDLRTTFAWHSGDITSAPEGACEFIDIDIPKAIGKGVRYAVTTVHGFTPQDFCDLPECSMGWMSRENPQSGEIFDPRTVEDKLDLAMAARSGVPFIVDLANRSIIWCDSALEVGGRYIVNNETTKNTIQAVAEAFTNVCKPDVYSLLKLHAVARGEVVETAAEADIAFTAKSGIQYKLDVLASEYMANPVKESKVKKAKA